MIIDVRTDRENNESRKHIDEGERTARVKVNGDVCVCGWVGGCVKRDKNSPAAAMMHSCAVRQRKWSRSKRPVCAEDTALHVSTICYI